MDIREIKLSDLDLIIDKYIEYFNNYEDSEWTNEKVQRKFKQLVNREDYLGLGIYKENEMIGFSVGALSQFDDGLICMLNELFMIKDYQSQGFGSKLITEFEKLAKEKGAFRIQLESANDGIHRRFYNEMHKYQDAQNNILKSKAL